MNKKTLPRAALGVALAASTLLSIAQAATPVAPPSTVPVDAFFSVPEFSAPRLSPDGTSVAILLHNDGAHRVLAVVDTSDLHKIKVVASYSDADITHAWWVDNDRLVYETGNEEAAAADQRGNGYYAVDRNGDNLRELIQPWWQKATNGDAGSELGSHLKQRALKDYHFVRTLSDGSGDVLIERDIGRTYGSIIRRKDVDRTVQVRLDTRTGLTHDAFPGAIPEHVDQWLFNAQGHLAAAVALENGNSIVLVPDAHGELKELSRFPAYTETPDAYRLLWAADDGTTFATRTMPGTDGERALFRIDLSTGKLDAAPLVSLKGFDFTGSFVENRHDHKLLGIHYVSDGAGTVWFDPDMKAVQAKVDAHVPNLVNVIDVATCGCSQKMLVSSHSDRQPAVFFLYDRATDALTAIGNSLPQISARQMADTDFVRIKARDGHDIPVYITKPHGKGPWPTVVYVHGGPWLRGWQWQWDDESQFLASRGYLVVKPEYRGSTGYGNTLFHAGDRQWGLASQDDIADATVWAASKGLADAGRTCIMGASYGGYATLMGLVRYDNLYRCGVAWSAVTDISLMYDLWQSDMSEEMRGYGMPALVGDREKDAAQFDATSPLKQAARIKRPLLLAHGGVDFRVPVQHALDMRDALNANHAPLTWISYPKEAHGWHDPQTNIAFQKEVLKFLDANIGPNAAVAADASKP